MITAEEVREYCKHNTVAEAVANFGLGVWTVREIKKGGDCRHALQRLILPDRLSAEQEEFMAGNLLGDGSLDYQKGHNSFFIIKQKLDKKEYINGLAAIYAPFTKKVNDSKSRKPVRKNGKISHKIQDWNGEYCYSSSLRTVGHPIFTKLRDKWYTDDGKKVPDDLRLTWRAAATWACDDGCCHNIKYNRFTLSTQSFAIEDVEFLIERMQKDLGVHGKLNLHTGNKPIINLNGEESLRFIEGIKPFVPWNCFAYKLKNKPYKRMHIYRGVDFSKGKNRWRARGVIMGRQTLNKSFLTKEEAIMARENWEKNNVKHS